MQGLRAVTLLKRDSNTGVFLWNLQNFWEQLFWRTSTNDYFLFFFFQIRFSRFNCFRIHIWDWLKLISLLQQYGYQNFHVSAVTPLLSYVIKPKNCRTLFFSFIFNELTSKFTWKHLRLSLFFNKVASRPATLLKKRLRYRCFPVNFAKFLGTPFLTEHLRWLLLNLTRTRFSLVRKEKQ